MICVITKGGILEGLLKRIDAFKGNQICFQYKVDQGVKPHSDGSGKVESKCSLQPGAFLVS